MIPCKRPRVTIEAHPKHLSASDTTATYHLVTCGVPGCDWDYDAAVATDAADQATWHRQAHRQAVPAVEHGTYIDDGRKVDLCACGWATPPGFSTLADRGRLTARHLEDDHGLVSC